MYEKIALAHIMWYFFLPIPAFPSKILCQNNHWLYFLNTGGSCSDTAAVSSFSILEWIPQLCWLQCILLKYSVVYSSDILCLKINCTSHLTSPHPQHILWRPHQNKHFSIQSSQSCLIYQNHLYIVSGINELISYVSSSLWNISVWEYSLMLT